MNPHLLTSGGAAPDGARGKAPWPDCWVADWLQPFPPVGDRRDYCFQEKDQ